MKWNEAIVKSKETFTTAYAITHLAQESLDNQFSADEFMNA